MTMWPPAVVASGSVAAIVRDLEDRRSLRQVWEEIDDDIKKEIMSEWGRIIEERCKSVYHDWVLKDGIPKETTGDKV